MPKAVSGESNASIVFIANPVDEPLIGCCHNRESYEKLLKTITETFPAAKLDVQLSTPRSQKGKKIFLNEKLNYRGLQPMTDFLKYWITVKASYPNSVIITAQET